MPTAALFPCCRPAVSARLSRTIRAVAPVLFIAAAAGTASADRFWISGLIEASSSPAALGSPVILIGGEFFHHPMGGDTPPAQAEVSLFPLLAYDSYLTVDGDGFFSSASHTANTPSFTPDPPPFTAPDRADFAMWHVPYEPSGLRFGRDALAFARLSTYDLGTTLLADDVYVMVRERLADDTFQNVRINIGIGHAATSGTLFPNLIDNWPTLQAYTLSVHDYTVNTEFGALRVFDLYVTSGFGDPSDPFPAPGTAAALALAGVAAIRRRRR